MHCRGIAPRAAAGGEAEQALRIDAGIPSQPGERIWEGAGGFQLDGSIRPLKFRPENGPAVVIGPLLDVRQAPALKAGARSRATPAGGWVCCLFHDSSLWFTEKD